MAKTGRMVLVGIVALVIAYAFVNFWPTLRPGDDQTTVILVGVVTFFAAFISLYFMTKGSGGD
jgi:hypothetical protein